MAVGGLDVGAHRSQGRRHALHGPRSDRLASPVSTVRKGDAARSPASRRIEVPEFPQSSSCAGSTSPERPSPSTSSGGCDAVLRPRRRSTWNRDPLRRRHRSRAHAWSAGRPAGTTSARHAAVERTSREAGSLDQRAGPASRGGEDEPAMRDRLVAGHADRPSRWPPGVIRTRMRRPQASRIGSKSGDRQRPGRPTSAAVGGHGEVHGPAAALRRVHDLQVLDVDLASPSTA